MDELYIQLQALAALEPDCVLRDCEDDEAYLVLEVRSNGQPIQTIWMNKVPELQHHSIAQGITQHLILARGLIFNLESDAQQKFYATVQEISGIWGTAIDSSGAIALIKAYISWL